MLLSAHWGLDCFHLIMDDNGWMGLSHSLPLSGELAGLMTPGMGELDPAHHSASRSTSA